MVTKKPARWSGTDPALRAVQVAFDVEQGVLEAVRLAAFKSNLSTPDQIRHILRLPTSTRPKRPRLTVSLTAEDYETLGARYGVDPQERLMIKERVTEALIQFSKAAESERKERS